MTKQVIGQEDKIASSSFEVFAFKPKQPAKNGKTVVITSQTYHLAPGQNSKKRQTDKRYKKPREGLHSA
jgi:hypothetical protein